MIKKISNLKKMTKGAYTILVNVEKKSWVKVEDTALKIIDLIDGMEYEAAVAKVQDEFNADSEQVKEAIQYLINTGIIENYEENQYVNLIYEEDKNKNNIGHCYLHITNRCNLKCGYCSYDARNDENKELSTNIMKSIIRRLYMNNITQLVFAGGEPLCRKDFKELVEYARKFFNDIGLVTNATLITPENAEFIAKNIDKIQISLDSGIAEDHDAIRGKGSFEKTVQGVKLIKSFRHDQVKITPTVNRVNVSNIKSIVRLAKELDVMLDARYFLPVGRGSCNMERFSLDYSEMSEAFKQIWMECEALNYDNYSIRHFYDTYITPKVSCGVCKDKICVDVNGDVYPCAYLMSDDTKLGNLFDKINFYDGINNSEIGKKISERTVDNIEGCKNCEVRYFCGGGCMAVGYSQTGNVNEIGMNCTHYRKLISSLAWGAESNEKKSLLAAVGLEKVKA